MRLRSQLPTQKSVERARIRQFSIAIHLDFLWICQPRTTLGEEIMVKDGVGPLPLQLPRMH